MKQIITLYREYFQVADHVSDRNLFYNLLVLLAFMFTLGFTVSQVIIYLAR